jgi:SAM-dependent methyltransferase
MLENESVNTIESWLQLIRSHFIEVKPELLALFDTYAAEARFGRRFIEADLGRLRAGATVLEVGAGSLLLSCQLIREGFEVTALEPIGDGFSHFDQMRQLVLVVAHSQDCCPKILDQPAEELDAINRFDYAFSVNVMEHVGDVACVLGAVGNSLAVGASYRFTCPNYIFPYEPHFNIPILVSKKLTERVWRRKIFGSTTVPDPVGAWRSLNWINVVQVKRIIGGEDGFRVFFNRSMLASTLERIGLDTEFARRRSPVIRIVIMMLVRFRIHYLFNLIPAAMQPVIDCRIEKTNSLEAS